MQKAKEEFIKLCHEAYHATGMLNHLSKMNKAFGYSNAIQDILGLHEWLDIIEAAQASFEKGVKTVNGVPMDFKREPETAAP